MTLLAVLLAAPAAASPISDEERAVANFVCYVTTYSPDKAKGREIALRYIEINGGLNRTQSELVVDYVTNRYCPIPVTV